MSQDAKKPLGRILLQQRAVTQAQLDAALEEARATGVPLATKLTDSGTVSEVEALKALSEQSGVPGIDLNQVCIRLADLNILPREIAVRHKLLPVLVRDDRIFVAMAAPTEKKVIDELEFVTGKRVFPYIALAGPLQRVIAQAYEMSDRGEAYYVGPQCPPEVLRKAGLSIAPKAPEGAATHAAPAVPRPPAVPTNTGPRPAPATIEPRPAPAKPAASPPRPPPAARAPAPDPSVVVDDALNRMAAADELTDADFGNTGKEVSVVTDLPGDKPQAPKAGQRTVLIVDDEDEIRRLLRRVLESRGFRVREADRGNTALKLVKEEPPDVMILDAMLPEVHGFDIARRIKGSERYGKIPIVMVSAVYRGWRFAEDLKASYGVDTFIEKPFKIADVVSAVEKALEHKKESAEPAEKISAEAERHLAAGIAAYKAGDFEKAATHLREGTKIDPLAYRLHFHLGLLYGKQGQIFEAISELETALDINNKHFPALKNLAVLYQKAGFRNKAIETWERALHVAPDDATRQTIKEHLLGLL
ncbi:MAG: response regulator [Polyangiaceae bacterium]|nr:response regulator [Polyangiaceae bacterium]